MPKKISKTETIKQVNEFFSGIRGKSPKEIKKIKRLAANKRIPLKEKRKLFCKKCLNPYSGKEKIRIKNRKKSVTCQKCDFVSLWNIKNNKS